MGLRKHVVEQILTGACVQNQETKRKTLARQILAILRRGASVQPKQKNKNRGHNSNRFILRGAREGATQNRDKIPMGPSRGYMVQKEGSRELRHDGVATWCEIRRKLDRKTAEGGRRQFRGLL